MLCRAVMPCHVVLSHVQAVLLYILDAEGYMDLPIGSVSYFFLGYQGGGLPPAGHTQQNQGNPTAGGPRQSLTR